MMDHFKFIYTRRAAEYQRMIGAEDVDDNLLAALGQIVPLTGKRFLDLGTGTGRIPLLLSRQASQLIGLDLHAAMLRENQRQQRRVDERWGLVQGDIHALPFPSAWAELITAGWVIGHIRSWFDQEWQIRVGRVLREMHRVIVSGGALIILETLTTGGLAPTPPSQALADYYDWLEYDWGFSRQEISTDYEFDSIDEAIARTEFFFGPEMSTKIRDHGWKRLPEWTGVWSKQL